MESTARKCSLCGWPIEGERAEVLPDTRLCFQHANALSRFGGELLVRAPAMQVRFRSRLRLDGATLTKLPNTEGVAILCRLYRRDQEAILETFAEFRPEWRTAAVLGMADAVASTADLSALPILADALEEAGCDDRKLLAYCRTPERWWTPSGVAAWIRGRALVPDDADS
jgi:hypothetical protein